MLPPILAEQVSVDWSLRGISDEKRIYKQHCYAVPSVLGDRIYYDGM